MPGHSKRKSSAKCSSVRIGNWHVIEPLYGSIAFIGVMALLWLLYQRWTLPLRGIRRVSAIAGGVVLALSAGLLAADIHSSMLAEHRTIVLLVDMSASNQRGAVTESEKLAEALLMQINPADKLAVVAFAEDAEVVLLPTTRSQLAPGFLRSQGVSLLEESIPPERRRASRLRKGLTLARMLLPGNTQSSMILVSDGQCQYVDAQLPQPLSHVPLPSEHPSDVAIKQVWTTTALRGDGQRDVNLDVLVFASTPANARLVVSDDAQTLAEVEANVPRGVSRLELPVTELPAGDLRVTVKLESSADTVPGNESLSLLLPDPGLPPQVALVDDTPGFRASTPLRQALETGAFGVRQMTSAELVQLPDFDQWQALALVSVEAQRLPTPFQERLNAWVHSGGALIMLGSTQSFAPGGWNDSPVEAVLPVLCRTPREEGHDVAVIVAMDRSGSMGANAGVGTKMDQANRGCEMVLRELRDRDSFAVVATDSSNQWVIPLAPVTDRREAVSNIRSIEVGSGGIMLNTAMTEVQDVLLASNAKHRHIVLFSDASDTQEQGDWNRKAGELRREHNITTSVIALGSPGDSDSGFLQDMAAQGGGAFAITNDAEKLPGIFSKTASQVFGGYLVEEPLSVAIGAAGILNDDLGLGRAPALRGYVLTKARPESQVWLTRGGSESPILATRLVGLGRTMVFTSDAEGRWADAWLDWEGYARCWQRWFRWLAASGQGAFEADTQVLSSAYGTSVLLAHEAQGRGSVNMQAHFSGTLSGDAAGRSLQEIGSRIGPARTEFLLPAEAGQPDRLDFWLERDGGDIAPLGQVSSASGELAEHLPRWNAEHTWLQALVESSGGVRSNDILQLLQVTTRRVAIERSPALAGWMLLAASVLLVCARRFPSVLRGSDWQVSAANLRMKSLAEVRQRHAEALEHQRRRSGNATEAGEVSAAYTPMGVQTPEPARRATPGPVRGLNASALLDAKARAQGRTRNEDGEQSQRDT